MEIDLKRQLVSSGNGSYQTNSIIDPTEHVDLSGTDVKMASAHDKSYAKTRKDSQVSNSSKSTK